MTVENMRAVRRLRPKPLLTKRTRILWPTALILFMKIQMRLVREAPRAVRTLVRLLRFHVLLLLHRWRLLHRRVIPPTTRHPLNCKVGVLLHQLHDVGVDLGLGYWSDADAANGAGEAVWALVDLNDRLERLLFNIGVAGGIMTVLVVIIVVVSVVDRKRILFGASGGGFVDAHVAVARVDCWKSSVTLAALKAPLWPHDFCWVEFVS